MKIFLLTHERELNRPTNTGAIAINKAGSVVQRVLWQRTNPDKNIVELISRGNAMLLHPGQASNSAKIEDYENIIIIDGTWQESRKIYNKSHYLKQAPLASLKTPHRSLYKLRRNQVPGGLCTIECVIEVLRLKGKHELASTLAMDFSAFNR